MNKNTNNDSTAMARIAIKLIASCFKPLSDTHYWKSLKDDNNVWRKQKVELTDEEITEKISEKRLFLSSHPLMLKMDGLFIGGTMIDKDKLLKRFDEFVENGCRGDFLIEFMDEE